MNFIFAGDMHGSVKAAIALDKYCIDNKIDYIIQVGDFGLLFEGNKSCRLYKFFEKRARQKRKGPTYITCGGNHENYCVWDKLSEEQGGPDLVELCPRVFWAKRGAVIPVGDFKMLMIGGAESIDRGSRTIGKNWWERETPNREEFNLFYDNLVKEEYDYIVSHDVPSEVPLYKRNRDDSITPKALSNALKLSGVKGKTWLYGHHHKLRIDEVKSNKFICCGLHGEFYSPIHGFLGVDLGY